MLFYYSIFLILLLLAYIEVFSNNKKYSHKTLFLVIFLFFILSFIRWETGTDWEAYYQTFTRIETPWKSFYDDYSNFEPGFMILYHIAKTLSNSYTMMLFIEGFIIYVCLFKSLKRYSIYPLYSLLMFYAMSLAGIFFVRQNIAVCILLCSIPYILKKEKYKFLLIVFIAFLIHRTSIVFLIAYPLFHKYYKIKTIFFIITISTIIGISFGKLFLMLLGSFNLGIITEKLNAYLSMGTTENYTTYSSTSVLIRGLVNRAFLIILYLSILNKIREKNIILNGFINLNLLGVVLYVILTPIAFSLGRITAYFDIIQIFIIPYLIKASSYQTKHIIMFILSIYLSFRLYTIISSFPDLYIPYKTFIEQ